MLGNRHVMPEWCWHRKLECVVKVLKTGHFPGTAIVRLPDDREIEVEINDLEAKPL